MKLGRGILIAALALLPPGEAFAGSGMPSIPCDPNTLGNPYLKFIYGGSGGQALDPATACSALDNTCAKVEDFRAGNEGSSISVCRLVYEHMKATAERYRQAIGGNYCQSVTQLGKGCSSAQASAQACLSQEAEQHEQKEKEILDQLNSDYNQLRALQLDRKIQQLQAKLNQDKSALRSHSPLSCDKDVNGVPIPPPVMASQLQLPATDRSSAQGQLNELKRHASDFASVISKSTRDHQSHVANFHSIFTKSGDLARKLASADPNAQAKRPSDITGGDREQAQQQQGGGGQPGGGQPGGGGGGDSGPQASGGAPGESGAGGVGPGTMGAAGKDDSGTRPDGSGGSSDGAKPEAPQPRRVSSTGGPSFQGSSVGSSGATPSLPLAATSFGSGGASSPSRAGASGGGASSLGGGDSSSPDSHCSGKDCQALGGAGMFGGVGALGSGSPAGGGGEAASGGLAPLDTGSLDNLFKDDKNKAGAPPGGADANMAGLDAATASLAEGAAPAGDGGTQAGNEIGSADNDLFTRLHDFHVRAQKAGRIVGMTRKL